MQVLFLQALFYPVLFWAFSDLSRGFFWDFSSHAGLFREPLHLYLALLCCKDDFFRPDSSPASSFSPQG